MTNLKRLMALTAGEVSSIYSGKPGCACGCRGSYADTDINPRAVQQRLANMKRFATGLVTGDLKRLPASMAGVDIGGARNWISFESESRVYTVYFYERKKVAV